MKALLLALPVFLLSPLGNAEPLPPISHWIPSNSVVMLEITRPELLINPVFDPELAQFVVSLPAYLAQQDNPEFGGAGSDHGKSLPCNKIILLG